MKNSRRLSVLGLFFSMSMLIAFPSISEEMFLKCGWGKKFVNIEYHNFIIDIENREVESARIYPKFIVEQVTEKEILFYQQNERTEKKEILSLKEDSEYCREVYLNDRDRCVNTVIESVTFIRKFSINRYSGEFGYWDHYSIDNKPGKWIDGRGGGTCEKKKKVL